LGNPVKADSRFRFASAFLAFAAEREIPAVTNRRLPFDSGCRAIWSTMRIWVDGKRRVKDSGLAGTHGSESSTGIGPTRRTAAIALIWIKLLEMHGWYALQLKVAICALNAVPHLFKVARVRTRPVKKEYHDKV
jgi:hypothetical protein